MGLLFSGEKLCNIGDVGTRLKVSPLVFLKGISARWAVSRHLCPYSCLGGHSSH